VCHHIEEVRFDDVIRVRHTLAFGELMPVVSVSDCMLMDSPAQVRWSSGAYCT